MASLGRQMFGVAFIGFALLQFIFGDIVPGRPPAWPPTLLARLFWVYLSGAWFLSAGAAIIANHRLRLAAYSIALLVFGWAAIRNLPVALADPTFGSAWTKLGKAVAFTGGALAVAGLASVRPDGSHRAIDILLLIGRVSLGIFLIDSGVQHFLHTDSVKLLVPEWIPSPRFWTLFAGTALIAGGIGLIVQKTTRLAAPAVAAMLFTWLCILHVPRALSALPPDRRGEWTSVFEALAFAGVALILTYRSDPRSSA